MGDPAADPGAAEAREALLASRARVLAAADDARRRLQHDLHDGPQQRLTQTVIALKIARDTADLGPVAAGLVDEALTSAERASSQLRAIVHAILPGSLAYGGLRSGLESLVADLAQPVEVRISTPRLPPAVETTAYVVVAEALANAVTHARAQRVALDVELAGDTLVVEVRDDGVGGADPRHGTGLTGLFDRVDTAAGSLTVSSPPGQGTTLRAKLPINPDGHGA